MSPEEKQRMIHIRIKDGVHRELRKVAAEYDLTIQDIVSGAVEETIEEKEIELKLEERRERLEKKAHEMEKTILERLEPLRVKIESEFETELPDLPDIDPFLEELPEAVMAKLMKIEKSLGKMSLQLAELTKALVENED